MAGIKGGQIAGGNSIYGRVEHDYYATPPWAVEWLLDAWDYNIQNRNVLEPCVGGGHIANVLESRGATVTKVDIVKRIDDAVQADYLLYKAHIEFDAVITNPPYSLAEPFIRKAIDDVKDTGVVAMLLKLSFLEGQKRKLFFKRFPPKYVYVFSKRVNIMRNGEEFKEDGTPWNSPMAFAWFIWEKGFHGEPIIRWL